MPRDHIVRAEECDIQCSGQPSPEPCGGSSPDGDGYLFTIYGRTLDRASNQVSLPLLLPGSVLWESTDCYSVEVGNLNEHTDGITGNRFENLGTGLEDCIRSCKEENNWKYAMAYTDGTCRCYGILPTAQLSDECDNSCPGYPDELCSGPGQDNVPRVRFWTNPSSSARAEYPPESEVRPLFSIVCSNVCALL